MNEIAIITTVYNTEEYVGQMINSVLSQTYSFFKLFIVNDASSDNSLQICQYEAKKDPRIVVLNLKKNVGLGMARNYAIEYVQKLCIPYITFLDSDDYIERNYLKRLLFALENSDCNISISSYTHSSFIDSSEISIINSVDLYKYRKKYSFYPSNCATSKLYKTSIFKDVRFNDKKHEDIYLIPKIILSEKRIALVKAKLYFYRIREGSISFDDNSFRHNNLDRLYALESNFEFVANNNIDAFYHFANEYFEYLNLLICRTKITRKDTFKMLKAKKKESLKIYKRKIIKNIGANNYYRYLLTEKSLIYKTIARFI